MPPKRSRKRGSILKSEKKQEEKNNDEKIISELNEENAVENELGESKNDAMVETEPAQQEPAGNKETENCIPEVIDIEDASCAEDENAPEEENASEEENAPEEENTLEEENAPEEENGPEEKNGPKEKNGPEEKNAPEHIKIEEMSDENAIHENAKTEKGSENEANAVVDMPFKVKVSHLPSKYSLNEFQRHVKTLFGVKIKKIITPGKNSPWILIPVASKSEQENLVTLLHNHIWKKKVLRAIAFYSINTQKRKAEEEEPSTGKKLKIDEVPLLTLEEEILSESLPLYSIPYEEQNQLTKLDVEVLSSKLHAFMCIRNPALVGWAEAMCEKNGTLFKIEPLKPSPVLEGYRNKCKFRIGKNTEGEITVGFCLNDNENKILGVQPGDKLIHLPDSMKYAAKKFEDFIRASNKEPYDKKEKSGYWDHIIIRIAPEGSLMLVIVMYHNNESDESIAEIKNQVKEYFVNGDGKDCNLYSLYFQIWYDKQPVMPPEKLELLHGESHFYENICGLKFYVGPFSILNVNSSSSENIYKSIAELADPTPETTVIDLCSGTGGIAFTIANKCKNVIAIESHGDHISDALKTKELNNIENVEFIKGKVEEELANVFQKLGNSPVVPIIDPPRQGLVQKAISQLRANENIKKLVYVCSNSKMGSKNFLDFCASADKKEGTFGNPLNVVFAGLPFLPVRAIPVDVAPYTVNNTIIILFERTDPSTFPPAKNPPPLPVKKAQLQKFGMKTRMYIRRMSKKHALYELMGNKFRKGGRGRGRGGGYGGQFFRRGGGVGRGGTGIGRGTGPGRGGTRPGRGGTGPGRGGTVPGRGGTGLGRGGTGLGRGGTGLGRGVAGIGRGAGIRRGGAGLGRGVAGIGRGGAGTGRGGARIGRGGAGIGRGGAGIGRGGAGIGRVGVRLERGGGTGMGIGGQSGVNQGIFSQSLLTPMDPALSLVAKYERRIAELEQQDRAFKAGLSMGLQALSTRGRQSGNGSGINFENFSYNIDPNGDNKFGGGSNQFMRDPPAWQRGVGRNFGNLGMGYSSGENNFGGGFSGSSLNNYNNGGGFNRAGTFNNYTSSSGYGNTGRNDSGDFNSSFGSGTGFGFRNYQGNKR